MSKKSSETVLHTKNEKYEFDALWTIENFLMHPNIKQAAYIESAPFSSAKTKGKVEWCLMMNPNGAKRKRGEIQTFVALFLKLNKLSDAIEHVLASFRLAIIDANGNQQKLWQGHRSFFQVDCYHGVTTFITLEELQKEDSDLLKNGDLTVQCHVDATLKYKNVERKVSEESESEVCNKTLTEMLEGGICADVVLRSKDLDIKCHKSVLSARSLYFRAMFQNDMKENRENLVDLSKEMNATELDDLVNFIYTGKAANLNQTCYNLYHVADVYGLDSLKHVCESELIKKISPETAVELLVFAEENGAKKLQKKAAKHIYDSS